MSGACCSTMADLRALAIRFEEHLTPKSIRSYAKGRYSYLAVATAMDNNEQLRLLITDAVKQVLKTGKECG